MLLRWDFYSRVTDKKRRTFVIVAEKMRKPTVTVL